MKKKRYIALSAAIIACIIGSGIAFKPVAESYVTPVVQAQLNKTINGHMAYDSMEVTWNGKVALSKVIIKDTTGQEVGYADSVVVGLSPVGAARLLAGDGAAALVSEVTVSHGDLHVWQDDQGKWNVEDLIKKDPSSKESSFKGDVHLDQVDLTVRPYKDQAYRVEAISGGLSLSDSPVVKGNLTCSLEGQALSVSGTLNTDNTKEFTAHIKADRLDASLANMALAGHKDIRLEGGYAKNIALTISSDNEHGLTWEGHAAIRDVSGTYNFGGQGFRFDKAQTNVAFSNNNIIIKSGSAYVNGQKGEVSGSIAIQDDRARLNLDVIAAEVEPGALIGLPVGGRLAGQIHVGGDTLSPTLSGRLVGHDVTYGDYSLDKLGANVSLKAGHLVLEDIRLDKGNTSLSGQASYDINSGNFDAAISPDQFDISQIAPMFGYDLGGTLSGQVYIHGQDKHIQSIIGQLEARNLTYQGISLDTVSMGFTSDGKAVDISYLNGTIGEGAFTGYGSLKEGQADISLAGYDIPLSMLSSRVGYDLDGVATVNAHILGSLDDPKGHVTLTAGKIGLGSYGHFDSLNLDGDIENYIFTIHEATIMDQGGFYKANGTIGWQDKALDIYAEAKDTRIENIANNVADIPVTGWFYTQNHITGTLDNPNVVGRARLKDGSINGFLVSDLYARYSYKDNRLSLYDAALESYGSKIFAQGTMDGKNLNFSFTGDGIYLKPLVSDDRFKVDGYIAAQGTLTGTLDKPIFNGNVRSRQVLINGTALNDIDGTLYADPTVVNVESMSFTDQDNGAYSFVGGVKLKDPKNLFGKVSVSNADIKNMISIFSQDESINGRFTGRLNGTVGLGGTVDNPALDVKGAISSVALGDQVLGDSTIDASLADKKITIRKLQLPVDSGMIAAGGTMDLNPGGQTAMQVAVNSVDLKYFKALLPDSVDPQGTLSSVVNLSGDSHNPKAEISADLISPSYNGVALDHVFMLATMEDQVLNIQALMGQKGAYRATVAGKLPLAAMYTSGYLAPSDDKSMNLTIDLSQADLAVVPLMTPYVTDGQGAIGGKIKLTGSIEAPQAFGTVTVRNGALQFKNVAKPLEGINADLIFNGNKATLQGDAQMGKGAAGFTGQFTWWNRQLTGYQGALQLDNLEVDNEYIKGPLTAELYATDVDGVPTLTGHVDLHDTRFKIPLSIEGSDSALPFALDVTVKAGKNVRLYDRTLYDMTIDGSVRFAGHTYWPTPSGAFNVKDGTFKYLSHTFRITKGIAQFRQGSYIPSLDLQAETQVNDYAINLGVKGTVDQLDLSLSSNPSLSRKQIISMLTFGRGADENSSTLSHDDATAVGISAAQMYAFGYVEEAAKRALGLDLINITTGSVDPDEPLNKATAGYYNIEIGKYLIPNLMVTYSQGLNNNDKVYGVRYKLGKHTSTRAWRSSNNHSFVGAYWKTTF